MLSSHCTVCGSITFVSVSLCELLNFLINLEYVVVMFLSSRSSVRFAVNTRINRMGLEFTVKLDWLKASAKYIDVELQFGWVHARLTRLCCL